MIALSSLLKPKHERILAQQQELIRHVRAEDRSLTVIEWSSTVDEQFIEELCEGLRNSRYVKKLKFHGTDMNVGAGYIAAVVRRSLCLTHIRISSANLSDDSATALLGGLMDNVSVVSLALDENRLSRGEAIAMLLKTNNILQHLDLSSNELGDEAVSQIAASFEHNAGLRVLALQGNKFTEKSAKLLCDTLRLHGKTSSLTQLELGTVWDLRLDIRGLLVEVVHSRASPSKPAPSPPRRPQGSPDSSSVTVVRHGSRCDVSTTTEQNGISYIIEKSEIEGLQTAIGEISQAHFDAQIERENVKAECAALRQELEKQRLDARAVLESSKEAFLKELEIVMSDRKELQERLAMQRESSKAASESLVNDLLSARAQVKQLQERVTQLEKESESEQRRSAEAASAAATSRIELETEVKNLHSELDALRERQIAEIQGIDAHTRALRTQLDSAAAKLTSVTIERDAKIVEIIETEKLLHNALFKSVQFQRALEHLTSSPMGSLETERQALDCATETDLALLTDTFRVKGNRGLQRCDDMPSLTQAARQATDTEFDQILDIDDHFEEGMTKARWVDDSSVDYCMANCGKKFNLAIRKHHCRRCGRIFCNSCCPKPKSKNAERMCLPCQSAKS